MKQAIAGVSPPEASEVTVMTVWPSLAGSSLGQLLGRLYSIKAGVSIFNVGNAIAILSIPLALALFFTKFAVSFLREIPYVGFLAGPLPGLYRYRLTNRRVIVQAGLHPVDERWVELDRFDRIEVQIKPGQQWYPAGDLVFFKGPIETFRLIGVLRPETLRRTCLKAQQGYIGTRRSLQESGQA